MLRPADLVGRQRACCRSSGVRAALGAARSAVVPDRASISRYLGWSRRSRPPPSTGRRRRRRAGLVLRRAGRGRSLPPQRTAWAAAGPAESVKQPRGTVLIAAGGRSPSRRATRGTGCARTRAIGTAMVHSVQGSLAHDRSDHSARLTAVASRGCCAGRAVRRGEASLRHSRAGGAGVPRSRGDGRGNLDRPRDGGPAGFNGGADAAAPGRVGPPLAAGTTPGGTRGRPPNNAVTSADGCGR